MPINRGEFEKGELDPSFVLEEFLRNDDDHAYSVDELIIYMASKKIALTVEEVQQIMRDLETAERVRSNIVRDTSYYIFRKPISSRST